MKSRTSPRQLRQRGISLALAAGLLATVLTVSSQTVGAETASASTTSLRTASSTTALANALALADFPTGSAAAVVAQNEKFAIHLASSYAARFNLPLVVATSGTSAASVLPTLNGLTSSQVVLVSSTAGWFASSFQQSLTAASIAISSEYTSTDLFARYSAAALSASATEYVLAATSSTAGMMLATSYAATRGLPLVVWEATTSGAALGAFFTSVAGSPMTYFGDTAVLPSDRMSEAQFQALTIIDVADTQRAFTWIAAQVQTAGIASNRIVVSATGGSYDRLGIAGAHARKVGALLTPQLFVTPTGSVDPAGRYISLWGSELASLELVGVNVSSWALNSLAAPTTVDRSGPPAFRATGLTKDPSSYSLSLSTVSGATTYSAYDVAGTLVASSNTPVLAYSSQVGGLLVVARSGTTELARLEVRANDYSTTAQRTSVTVGSTNAGTNHLVFLNTTVLPRLITRVESDPFAFPPTEGPEIPVAVTCQSSFTDVGLDPTKEYTYSVAEMTNVNAQACDPTYSPLPATSDDLLYGQVPLPFTAFPTSFSNKSETTETALAASPTTMDLILAQAAADSEAVLSDGIGAQLAPGDDWQPVIVRWQAFIPEGRFPFGCCSNDPSRPFAAFGGDNHGTNDPNGSHRFEQDLTFYWGTNHHVVYSEDVGETHLYKCAQPVANCVLVATGEAPASELSANEFASTNTSASAHVWAQATNPLVSFAPPIDTDWRVKLSTSGSFAYGYHDNMPQHELYVGVLQSEFYRMYTSPYISWAQLPCLYSSPSSPRLGCATYFNVQL